MNYHSILFGVFSPVYANLVYCACRSGCPLTTDLPTSIKASVLDSNFKASSHGSRVEWEHIVIKGECYSTLN